MRIAMKEQIFLSMEESKTWENFYHIINGLTREVKNPYTQNLLTELRSNLDNLWEEVEEIE